MPPLGKPAYPVPILTRFMDIRMSGAGYTRADALPCSLIKIGFGYRRDIVVIVAGFGAVYIRLRVIFDLSRMYFFDHIPISGTDAGGQCA